MEEPLRRRDFPRAHGRAELVALQVAREAERIEVAPLERVAPEVVDDEDVLLAPRVQDLDDVGADEPGPAGDDAFHGARF